QVESALEATHLVAGGGGVPLKRTPKLLAGMSRCRFILDLDWLVQSAREGRALEGVDYMISDME
ncbi:unnamed protein product, partial [Discosporangium mesarthrocarpum]